jgi:hypothetical protein
MEQERTETFVFKGKEYKVTPEAKRCCEQLQECVRRMEELMAEHGNFELPEEVCRDMQQAAERIVAEAGLNCSLSQFLKVRA